jgi:hypothetical protein
MSEMEESVKTEKDHSDENRIANPDDEMKMEIPRAPSGLRERVRKLLANTKQGRQETKRELAKDRTRSLALLIGGTVGAMLLFIGVFSTPTTTLIQQTSGHATPNLGRKASTQATMVPSSSVTPLLNADVQSNDGNSDQLLSPADIQGTSRQASSETEVTGPEETRVDTQVPRGAIAPRRTVDGTGSSSRTEFDPLLAYRLNNRTGTRTYSYGGPPPVSADGSEISSGTSGYGPVTSIPVENRYDSPTSVKSSIVFVRSTESVGQTNRSQPAAWTSIEEALLPPGTRLLARLEAAATTAVKMPVVASVEYNYERNGMIVVPAGAKVFGEVQQASAEGYLNVRFHTMQMPDGREEKIEGTGVALDQKPLKGEVSGKNTGRKVLSRTLAGIGTVAAYVVGAGGAGLGRTITGETLLRDRLASNIALAGEQELMNAVYSQNISVTVPANTRFYVVLQKAAVNSAPSSTPATTSQSVEVPTVQELRELMDLRREINRMYQESNGTPPGATKP